MFISISGTMIDAAKVKDVRAIGSTLYLYFNDGSFSRTIYCRNSSEAEAAVEKIAAAKNSTPAAPVVHYSGYTTDEKLESVDRQMQALAAKKQQLKEQKAAEDSAEALAALLVGGVCAIADAISSRKKRK